MSDRQFTYTRVVRPIGTYPASSQYPPPVSQQHIQLEGNVVPDSYGYRTLPQGSNHRGYDTQYGYSDSTFPNTSLTHTGVGQHRAAGFYNTEQPPYQDSIPTNRHIVQNTGLQSQPFTVLGVERDLEALFEGNEVGDHTTPGPTLTETMTRETADAVASIIPASNSPTGGQQFVKPHPKKAPGKVMPHHRGKSISRADTRHGSGDESDSSEDARDSDSDRTIEGAEEPLSPPPPASHGSDRKSKKNRKSHHHRDREPSVTSEPPPKRKKKSSRRRSKTPDLAPSMPKSLASEKSSRNKNATHGTRGAVEDSAASHPASPRLPSRTDRIEVVPANHTIAPLSTINEQLTNEVFSEVLQHKSLQKTNSNADNMSSLTKTTRARQPPRKSVINKLTWESLEKTHLMKDLQETDLARETIKALMRYFKATKDASASILFITYVKAGDTGTNGIRINTLNYLLSCSIEDKFGYSYKDLSVGDYRITQANLSDSLHNALRNPTGLDTRDSLDNVLRLTLREMVDEVHRFTVEANSGLDNPAFISGRYLELRLLQKIRNYYLDRNKSHDVIRCILPSKGEDHVTELQKLVDGNAATSYLRRLIGLYNITPKTFNKITTEDICTPSKMRVWTTLRLQNEVNVQIQSHISSVVKKTKDVWGKMTDEEKEQSALALVLEEEYTKSLQQSLVLYNDFLTAVLESSELMAWMCFGITTNATSGCTVMVDSYSRKKVEESKKSKDEGSSSVLDSSICWNYPLAAIFHDQEPNFQQQLPVQKSLAHYKAIDLDECL